MPYNIYISPVLSLSATEYDGAALEGDSEAGGGLTLSIGKEWWVSDNWGLGAALFVFGGSDTVKVKGDSTAYDVKSSVIGIMLTATYN
ncbi:MAG TPA: hypothetical protein VLM75_02945 [Spirochaetota bacterium]|nr:hypothetical protein [Spirochaetota bacterium]